MTQHEITVSVGGGREMEKAGLTEKFWSEKDRAASEIQNKELVKNIVLAVERDSARRVLVAVQCQRLHRIIPLLRSHENLLQIVEYQNL